MQVSQAAARPPSNVNRTHDAALELPYRRHQTVCTDHAFVTLLDAYRGSGGLASAEELLMSFKYRGGPDVSTLARWIVAGQVISFGWQSRTWLPRFQFAAHDMTPRADLGPILAELNDVYDECEMATWFATPNLSLSGRSPVQAFMTSCSAVVRAARIDRFVADA
jgi:hypothetical protein